MFEPIAFSVATVLMVSRIVATVYLVKVMRTQLSLMKRPIDAEITGFRNTLFLLTLALAGSNLLPIVFDATLIANSFGYMISFIPLEVYRLSNALAAALAAALVYKIYRNATTVDTNHEESDHTLMND